MAKPRKPRKILGRVAAVTLVFAFSLAALEAGLRLSGLADDLIASSAYYQGANVELYQESSDPFLHYELRPGAAVSNLADGAATAGTVWSATVNAHGARGRAQPAGKVPGVTRVLAFGGSTLFGHGVDDEETLPARLEANLTDDAGGRRVEVWNFGAQAYTLAQAARLARREMRRRDPDLVLVQLYNVGPRPFLASGEGRDPRLPSRLRRTPELYGEHYPAPSLLGPAAHSWLMARSAVYRSVAALVRRAAGRPPDSPVGDALSCAEAERLHEEAAERGVPVVFVTIPPCRGEPRPFECELWKRDDVLLVHLYERGREEAFYEVHPPPGVLDELAAKLADELRRNHVFPAP